MIRLSYGILLLLISFSLGAQQNTIRKMLADSSMIHGSLSILIADTESGDTIAEHNSRVSLAQGSVMKLITSAAALERLGPRYRFKTSIGYSGTIEERSKTLSGNIIIRGGGDPVLGSSNFMEHYEGFMEKWVNEISDLGIKRIKGNVIADDSYFDYQPVPPGWNWEDIGNYYGAGAYGISVFDNTLKLHFRTAGEGTVPELTSTEPRGTGVGYTSFLKAHGNSDMGYVYMSPYSSSGWISGTIPVNRNDFVLNASIPDPPLLTASLLTGMLKAGGIRIDSQPATVRTLSSFDRSNFTEITSTESAYLADIIEILNHESVNLYAEHLLKELGKVATGEGSNSTGIGEVMKFLESIGIKEGGMFIADGSGLSPQDAVSAAGMVRLLVYMLTESPNRDAFFRSLPEAGKEGTLKNYFKDPLFENRLWAKSGTLTRVKAYAGYFTAMSGREMAFCIIVNNFTGPSSAIIKHIESIIKETILNN